MQTARLHQSDVEDVLNEALGMTAEHMPPMIARCGKREIKIILIRSAAEMILGFPFLAAQNACWIRLFRHGKFEWPAEGLIATLRMSKARLGI